MTRDWIGTDRRLPFNFKRKSFKSVWAQRLKWKYKSFGTKTTYGITSSSIY